MVGTMIVRYRSTVGPVALVGPRSTYPPCGRVLASLVQNGATSATGATARFPTFSERAAELLAEAEGNPAITITDRAKALAYFTGRAKGNEAASWARPEPEQRPLRKVPVVAQIIRTFPGARFVQFIDDERPDRREVSVAGCVEVPHRREASVVELVGDRGFVMEEETD